MGVHKVEHGVEDRLTAGLGRLDALRMHLPENAFLAAAFIQTGRGQVKVALNLVAKLNVRVEVENENVEAVKVEDGSVGGVCTGL